MRKDSIHLAPGLIILPLVRILFNLSATFIILWRKCQRMFPSWCTLRVFPPHYALGLQKDAGRFDCLDEHTMEGTVAVLKFRNWEIHAIKQIQICAVCGGMVPRPQLFCLYIPLLIFVFCCFFCWFFCLFVCFSGIPGLQPMASCQVHHKADPAFIPWPGIRHRS